MNQKTLPYLLLLPATLFLLIFFVYPFVQVAVQAFAGPSGLTFDHFQTMARNFRSSKGVRASAVMPKSELFAKASGSSQAAIR